jgi:hypothetical protein
MKLDGITWQGPALLESTDLSDLPKPLAGLLRQLNGFILRGGALHVRGVIAAPSWHSIHRHWTGEFALAERYRSLQQTDVPFAQDCVGDQFFVREGLVWRLCAESDDAEPLDLALFDFLAGASASPVEFLSAGPLVEHLNAGGELLPGQLLFAYPPYCVAEAEQGVELKAVSADELIDVHAAMAQQIRDLHEGQSIRIDVSDDMV